MTTLRPFADERIEEMYRVRLYMVAEAALVAVAEPLVEERSAALAAGLLWDRYVALRAPRLEWVEILDARRPTEARAPLVVQCELTRGADGQVQARGWHRVAWAGVEWRCGGRIALEPRAQPLPAHRPTPVGPVAGAPHPAAVAQAASRWSWPAVPAPLRALTSQTSADAPA